MSTLLVWPCFACGETPARFKPAPGVFPPGVRFCGRCAVIPDTEAAYRRLVDVDYLGQLAPTCERCGDVISPTEAREWEDGRARHVECPCDGQPEVSR